MSIQILGIMCGFDAINEIAKLNKIEMTRSKFDGIYGLGSINRRKSNSFKTADVHGYPADERNE